MIFTTIRSSGQRFDVDDFLKTCGVKPDRIWRMGEPSRVGSAHETSGFNLEFPDAETSATALPPVHDYMKDKSDVFRRLQSLNVAVELNMGLTVGSDKSFSTSLAFPIGFMSDLVSLGIVLNVSGYPTSPDKS